MTSYAEALALARQLGDCDGDTAADRRQALLLFWYGSGASRLRAEEDILLAAWDKHGGADHPLAAVIRAGYARLAQHVEAVAEDPHPDPETLHTIGAELAAHVRLQDRGLRRAVIRSLTPGELNRLDDELSLFTPRA